MKKFHGVPRLVTLACVAISASAIAALPILSSKLNVSVVDAKTGKPVGGAIAAASETHHWSGYHRSRRICFRASSRLLDPTGVRDFVELPGIDPVASSGIDPGARFITAFVYKPGFCTAAPYSSGRSADFLRWSRESDPMAPWAMQRSIPSPKAGEDVIISLTPASDAPEHRIRHLITSAREISRSCTDLPGPFDSPLAAAMIREAETIASNQYERLLARRVADGFKYDLVDKAIWRPFHSPAGTGNVEQLQFLLRTWKGDPTLSKRQSWQEGIVTKSYSPDGAQGVLEEGFGLDSRDELGMTALMVAAYEMQYETARVLIEAGADASKLTSPDGYSAIDFVISRARKDLQIPQSEGQQAQLSRMLDLLANATPQPTVQPRYLAELATPEKWKVAPAAMGFWTEVRRRVNALPVRGEAPKECPIETRALHSLQLDRPDGVR